MQRLLSFESRLRGHGVCHIWDVDSFRSAQRGRPVPEVLPTFGGWPRSMSHRTAPRPSPRCCGPSTHAPDPKPTFASHGIQRPLSELTGHRERLPSDSTSANPDIRSAPVGCRVLTVTRSLSPAEIEHLIHKCIVRNLNDSSGEPKQQCIEGHRQWPWPYRVRVVR